MTKYSDNYFEMALALQEWALENGYGMPLREAMEAIDVIEVARKTYDD